MILQIVDGRPTYGHPPIMFMLNRRLWALGKVRANHKRAYRIMKRNGLLVEHHAGGPGRVHEGEIMTLIRNLRWCSYIFEISCWNGGGGPVVFLMDWCDLKVISYLASTSGISGEMIRDLMT